MHPNNPALLSIRSGGGKRYLPLSIDGGYGAGHETTNSSTTTAVTISTSLPNDVLIAYATINDAAGTVITSTSGFTWTKRASGGTSPNFVEEWWAVAPSALSNEVVTSTHASAFCALIVFAVNGANTTNAGTIFDGSAVTGTADPVSITTTNANTMIIGGFRGSTANPTADPAYVQMHDSSVSGFTLVESQIVSSSGGYSVGPSGAPTGTTNGAVVDAIRQGP